MDRRVKERLIGASILVALVVLVVPELLSGPKPNIAPVPTLPATAPEPIRNVTVDLTTSKPPASADAEPETPQAASAASSGGAAPETTTRASGASTGAAPTASNGASAVESTAPSAAYPPAAERPSAAAKQPPKAAPARPANIESSAPSPTSQGHGSWSVQLGSFASRANADNLTRQVKGQGFSVFVLAGGSGSSARYRVRVGPLADRESAERIAAKLKSLGHVGSLVAPAA
jgi:DedD protein